jgi:hypothetical protein
LRPTRVLVFVPVERSLRGGRLFAPLRDKVTSSASRSTVFTQAVSNADIEQRLGRLEELLKVKR